MKKQILVAAVLAALSVPALATDYAGTVSINEPDGTTTSTSLSNGATAYQTPIGVATVTTAATLDFALPTGSGPAVIYPTFDGGTGGTGASGALTISAPSAAALVLMITGNQSIDAGALTIGAASPALLFGQSLSFSGGQAFSNDSALTSETLQNLVATQGGGQILLDNADLTVSTMSGFDGIQSVNRGSGITDDRLTVDNFVSPDAIVFVADSGTSMSANLHDLTISGASSNPLNFNAAPGSSTAPAGDMVVNDLGGTIVSPGGVEIESYATSSAFPDPGHVVLNMSGTIDASYVNFLPGADLNVPDQGTGLNIDSAGDGSNPNSGATATLSLRGDSGDTYNYFGAVDGSVEMTGGNLHVEPFGSGMAVTGDYTQTGGNLYVPMTPQKTYTLNTGGYSITGGNVFLDAALGTYQKGGYTFLEATGFSNTYTPAHTYYVYNGTDSSMIDGQKTTLQVNRSTVEVCLGGTCVAPGSATQPAAPTTAPTTTTAPTHAPTHAPAPTQPVTPAPVQPSKPVQPVQPVQVVTPVEEAKPIVADSAGVTQAYVQNTAQTLVSTGVVGGGPRGIWLKTLGGFSSQDGYAGANYGLIAGYGWSVGSGKRDVAGVAFSAGQAGLGAGASDFTKASDYGLWAYGTFYPLANRSWKITGTVGAGLSTNTLMSTALGLPQTAHFGGSFMGTEIRASYWRTLDDGIIVSPRLSVGYNQSWTNGYSTHGGGPLDVNVGSQSDGQLYFEPAVLIGKKFASGNRSTIFPQVRVGAVESVGPNPSASVSSGEVAGQVQGLAYPHTQGMAEVRLDVISHTRYSKGLSANVSARQLFGGGASSTEFVAAIKYHW